MRPHRSLPALTAAALLSFSPSSGLAAAPEETAVDRAAAEAELAKGEVAEADRLVSAAVAERDRVEAQLLTVLDQYELANRRLEEAGDTLSRLNNQIDLANTELRGLRGRLADQAVTAYMQAVATSGAWLFAGSDAEMGAVMGESVRLIRVESLSELSALTAQRRELDALHADRDSEALDVLALRAEIERHAEELGELFQAANTELGAAYQQARAAQAEYVAALDSLDTVKAEQTTTTRPRPTTTRPPTPTTTKPATTTTTRASTTTTTASTATTAPATSTTTAATTTITTVTTTPPPPVASGLGPFPAQVEQWRPLVSRYFAPERIDEALFVIDCESNGDPNALNPYTGAAGLFQFLPGTWAVASAGAGISGADVFNPEANIAAAAWLVSYSIATGHPRGPWGHWSCRP